MAENTTTFVDGRGRDWAVRLSLPVVQRFCSRHGLALEEFIPKLPGDSYGMDFGQVLELAYMGTRHHDRVARQSEDLDTFLEGLTGPTLGDAYAATVRAITAFIQRHFGGATEVALATAESQTQTASDGPGATSAASGESPGEAQPTT
jgi:hypothetical protein